MHGIGLASTHLMRCLVCTLKMQKMTYQEQTLSITSTVTNQAWSVDENQLYLMWDDIRVSSVFAEKDASDVKKLVYGLLHATGYLSKIKIYDSKADCMVPGYQINSGLGRVLGFKEG